MAQLNRSNKNTTKRHKIKGVLRRTLFFAGLLALPAAACASKGVEFKFDSLAISGPQPLGEFGKEWAAPLESDTDSFAIAQLAVAYHVNNIHWHFSRVRLIQAQPNRDTTRFYHAEKNNTPFQAGEQFQLALSLLQVDYSRLGVAKNFSFGDGDSHWQINIGAIIGHQLIDGSLSGQAVAIDDKDYDFDFSINYHYTDDPLFNRPMEQTVRGFGLSVDLRLNHAFSDTVQLTANLSNALSTIWWYQAGQTNGFANSDNKTRDDEGFVTFDPVFTGKESNRDYVHRLPILADIKFSQEIDSNYTVHLQANHSPDKNWITLSGSRKIGAFTLSTEWIPGEDALGASVIGKNLHLRFLSDKLKFDDAHHLQVSAAYGLSF